MTAPASGNAHTTTAACALRFSNGGGVGGGVGGSVGGSVGGRCVVVGGGSVAPNTLIIKQQNDHLVRDFAPGNLRSRELSSSYLPRKNSQSMDRKKKEVQP